MLSFVIGTPRKLKTITTHTNEQSGKAKKQDRFFSSLYCKTLLES
jgi:hypothetical protein